MIPLYNHRLVDANFFGENPVTTGKGSHITVRRINPLKQIGQNRMDVVTNGLKIVAQTQRLDPLDL
jgi:hypothetical protein